MFQPVPTLVALAAASVIALTGCGGGSGQPAESAAPSSAASENTAASPESSPAAETYAMSEVATHNSAESCWTVINNEVYDVTKWIPDHPGGEDRILGLCGKDGSDAFEGQHAQDQEPPEILQQFRIGSLAGQ